MANKQTNKRTKNTSEKKENLYFVFVEKYKKENGYEKTDYKNNIEKFVPCEPPSATYQSTRRLVYVHGKPIISDSQEGKLIRQTFARMFRSAKPIKPIEEAVSLEINYFFKLPKNTTKKNLELISKMEKNSYYLAHTKRPDADNLSKLLIDCLMNSGFFCDDSIISKLQITKCYTIEESGIGIKIKPIQQSE